ncbi:alpha-amylase family glycosyl hydrolase [Pontiellaceae bacterium B1224]|nr:alpha-amylase family glycosyl hydrolase [Pontiellaceae bacterium B1224]
MSVADTNSRNIEFSLDQVNLSEMTRGRSYYPSPASWDDEVLYFLFVDRFSDGCEYGGFGDVEGQAVGGPTGDRSTARFIFPDDSHTAERESWFEAGRTWCGGTLSGLTDKLGYLKRLGVSAIWLSPIFRQVTESNDYHGYGIQNFLDVDPHFGTREELKAFVEQAHQQGIRVILDIILNHAGDVFAYKDGHSYDYYNGRVWPVNGFRKDINDAGSLPFGPVAHSEEKGAVWPEEFQTPDAWTRQGQIQGWDAYPEYLDGDFCTLKDLFLGDASKNPDEAWDVQKRIKQFRASQTLMHLAEVYKYWIAYADLDGYRIDTVKHMEPGAVRIFANVIHEFAQSLGKEKFYLIGEVTGGRPHAVNILNTTGIDAALGINDIPDKLEFLAKGWRSPGNPETEEQDGYFELFRNSLLDQKNTHQWFGQHVVTMFDDHDQVGTKHKFRFCGQDADSHQYLPAALGLNLTTIGIPCIYYGTEQAFSGADHRSGDESDSYSDVFLRECMFGGPFGALQSTDRHFFNESHSVYGFMASLCAVRRKHIALRRGRQYLRQVSATGQEGDFHFPQPIGGELRWVVAWSRIFADKEYICAMNTDATQSLSVWITVDKHLNPAGSTLSCLFSSDENQQGSTVPVVATNGSAVQVSIPPVGFAIFC